MHRCFCLLVISIGLAWMAGLLSGCGSSSEEIVIGPPPPPPPPGNGVVVLQLEYWQDGHALTPRTPINLVTAQNPSPPPVYIIQGKQFRIYVVSINGEPVSEGNQKDKVKHFAWGTFPKDKVVEWFDSSKGWFYHLDAQFPEETFCASGNICTTYDVSFRYIPVCQDQLPDP